MTVNNRPDLHDAVDRLYMDAMTMAMRLMGEDDDSFAPETREVMARWRPRVLEYIGGLTVNEKEGKGNG